MFLRSIVFHIIHSFAPTTLSLVALGAASYAGDDDRAAFRVFCSQRLIQLKSHYSMCRYEAREVKDDGSAKLIVTTSQILVGLPLAISRNAAETLAKSAVIPEFSADASFDVLEPRMIAIRNPDYTAMIGIETNGDFVLRNMTRADVGQSSGYEIFMYSCPHPAAIQSWESVAASATTEFEEFSRSRREGIDVVDVKLSFAPERATEFGRMHCHLTFAEQTGCCKRAICRLEKVPGELHFEYKYGSSTDPLALQQISSVMEGGNRTYSSSVSFRNWEFGTAPPKDQCYLTHYGLPEPPDPNGPREFGIPAWLWGLCLGLVLLGASVWLRRRNMQKT